jgi:flagellar protein FlbT
VSGQELRTARLTDPQAAASLRHKPHRAGLEYSRICTERQFNEQVAWTEQCDISISRKGAARVTRFKSKEGVQNDRRWGQLSQGPTAVPLRVELKPFERITIGETVIINSGTRTSFLIDGGAPVLREKDTITAETANTPVRRLYFCVQMMYLKNDVPKYRASYLGHVKDLRESVPGSGELIEALTNHISEGSLYKALKEIRQFIKREEERPVTHT